MTRKWSRFIAHVSDTCRATRGSPPPMRERSLGACLKAEFAKGMILVFVRMKRSKRRRPSQGLTQYFTRALSAQNDPADLRPADHFACVVLKGATEYLLLRERCAPL